MKFIISLLVATFFSEFYRFFFSVVVATTQLSESIVHETLRLCQNWRSLFFHHFPAIQLPQKQAQ